MASPSSTKSRNKKSRQEPPETGAPSRGKTARSAKTRERVLEAAIACVAEEGFYRASTNRIAERAGVTWGVLQYHFGDKQSILSAVLERSFSALIDGLRKASVGNGSLHQRVTRMVDVVWELAKSPSNRVTLELLLNVRATRGSDGLEAGAPYALLARMENENSAVWYEIFSDLSIPEEQSQTARRMFFATMHGLLVFHMVEDSQEFDAERAALVDALTYLLEKRSAHERG